MSSVTHSLRFKLGQPIEKVFPLFSAEGEKRWVPGWEYENVMGSTELCEDYVFVTKHHDHASTDAIWLVKRFDPESYFVQFYKIEPEDKVGVITVQCFQRDTCLTEVEVTYHYTGLCEKGNTFVKDFTASRYKEYIGEWKSLLIHYFQSKR